MRRSKKLKRHSRQGFSAWRVGILAFLFTAFVPAQAFAQAVCNSNLNWFLTGPSGGHWFIDDELTVNATLSAQSIGGAGTQFLQIPSFGFAGDCTTLAGLTWDNCVEANSVAIEYLGDPVSQNCKDASGQDIIFQLPESNTITFTPINPIHLAENTSCNISWDFRVAKFNSNATQATLYQVSAFAAGASPAACVVPDGENWLQIGTTSAGNNGGVVIDTCGIKVKKEICDSTATDCSIDSNWKNAGRQDNRLILAADGEALFRATITNTGSVAYVGNITVEDDPLGINTTIPSLAAGASTSIGGLGAGKEWTYKCQSTTNFKNQIKVEASCRGGEIPVFADDKNNAWAGCDNYDPPAPSILMLKEISVDDGDTWHDANTVGSAAIAVFPSDALYRFKVTNNGSAPLKNVVVNDSTLGINGGDEYSIGDMAKGAMVTITVDQEPLLYYPDRCEGRGTFTNTATASGASAVDDTPVSDSDPAVLKCIGEPHITIVKEISPTGNAPWYDDSTPPQEYPSDAWYRIKVTNDGTTPLTDVKVLDGDLLIDETIGNLAVNQQVILTSAEVSELYQKDRCTGSGNVGNTASASGKSLDDPTDTVNDSDTATLVCVGSPMIQVIKEISVNNVDWFDADTEGNALVTQAPSDAWYRITVKNTGPVGLTGVVLNDGTLGIFDYAVGDIGVGQQVVLTSGQISELYYPNRCTGRGTFGNTATANGVSSETGSKSSDSDEAWLECTGTPEIRIVKEISPNNGVTWYDGTTPSILPPVDALYRLTVTNIGTSALENVVVNDGDLGIVNYPVGNLAVNQTVVLTQGQIPQLYKEDRCTAVGTFVNTASASGDSVEYPYGSVNDSDSATLLCGEQIDICTDGGGRPKDLYLEYNGTYESDNAQGFVGDPNGTGPLPASPVTVKLFNKNTLEATINNVNVGDQLDVLGAWTKSGKIPPNIKVKVQDGNSNLLQTIKFHGSCSAPLNIGDKFGAVTITGYEPSD